MGCGGSKQAADITEKSELQKQDVRKKEENSRQQAEQIKQQAEHQENARRQQQHTNEQYEHQKIMLLEHQKMLIQQMEENGKMVQLAKMQAEEAATRATEAAFKKIEDMRRRLTPPAKPGHQNTLIQTDRTIPPHAIMKRRKPKALSDNDVSPDDHEERVGVGSEAVSAPDKRLVPVLIATAKTGQESRYQVPAEEKQITPKQEEDSDDGDEEYAYHYVYVEDQRASATPRAMIRPAVGALEGLKMVQPHAAPFETNITPAKSNSKDSLVSDQNYQLTSKMVHSHTVMQPHAASHVFNNAASHTTAIPSIPLQNTPNTQDSKTHSASAPKPTRMSGSSLQSAQPSTTNRFISGASNTSAHHQIAAPATRNSQYCADNYYIPVQDVTGRSSGVTRHTEAEYSLSEKMRQLAVENSASQDSAPTPVVYEKNSQEDDEGFEIED